jgi:hypothetical protein
MRLPKIEAVPDDPTPEQAKACFMSLPPDKWLAVQFVQRVQDIVRDTTGVICALVEFTSHLNGTCVVSVAYNHSRRRVVSGGALFGAVAQTTWRFLRTASGSCGLISRQISTNVMGLKRQSKIIGYLCLLLPH